MKCPKCGGPCDRDEADIGIGTIGGPWGCPACHWTEDDPLALGTGRPKLRVYLAGPSADLSRVKAAARALEAAGAEITERWWERVEEAMLRGWFHDSEVPEEYMRESAHRNREGIISADVVVALARAEGGFSSGVAGEICYALAERDNERIERDKKRIILVGDLRGYVFSWLIEKSDRVATIEQAVARMNALV